jgi:FtsH-binding integral membrane protein
LYQQPLLFSTLLALLLAMLIAALVVSVVPWDFSKMGPLLFLGLIVLIVLGVLSMIIPSMGGVMMSTAYNVVGVVIFTGYLMVDFAIMRYRSRYFPQDDMAIMLAVSILVDLVNLFLFLLRLGRR